VSLNLAHPVNVPLRVRHVRLLADMSVSLRVMRAFPLTFPYTYMRNLM